MSLASFVSFHNANGATPVGPEDSQTGLKQQTLTQLMATASNRSYVDNPGAVYGSLLATEATNANHSPFTANGAAISWTGTGPAPKVAVIGGGMSGLLSAYQLAKAGLNVTVYEAGAAPNSLVVGGKNVRGAGRIAPVVMSTAEGSTANVGSVIAQLGAMRFPSSAYLFWHYMKVSGFAAGTRTFTAFPNVGKVPTTFSGGSPLPNSSGVVKGMWGYSANPADVKALPTTPIDFEALNAKHIAAFTGYKPPNSPGNRTLNDITNLIVAGNPSTDTINIIKDFWKKTVTQLYNVNYRTFLSTSSYHPSQTFSSTDIARIGTLGFGTGGFGPLFSRCVLDLLRLVVWQYSDEFEVSDLGDYVNRLRIAASNKGVSFFYNQPVYSLFFSRQTKKTHLGLSNNTSPSLTTGGFDYVVLAMSTQAARNLLANGQSKISASVAESTAPQHIFPYYDNRYNWTSKIKRDLDGMDGMDSVKIFQAIDGPAVPYIFGLNWPKVETVPSSSRDAHVKTCFGTFDTNSANYQPIGLTYMFPVHPNATASGSKRTFASTNRAFALHYNWGSNDYGLNLWPNEAAIVKANIINGDSAVEQDVNATGKFIGNHSQATNLKNKLFNAMVTRFNFSSIQNLSVVGQSLSFRFSPTDADVRYAIVQWSRVPFINIGFKLDRPGYGASLIYSSRVTNISGSTTDPGMWDGRTTVLGFKFYTVHESVKNLYFAGCSISNYGGWVEGAFQSALQASVAVIESAARSRFLANNEWQSKINYGAYQKLILDAPDGYTLGLVS